MMAELDESLTCVRATLSLPFPFLLSGGLWRAWRGLDRERDLDDGVGARAQHKGL